MAGIVPIVRYVDTAAALRFLVDGLGFEIHGEITRRDDGSIAHAELRRDDGFLMMSDAQAPNPREVYLLERDPDALFETAVSAGAAVVYEPSERPYGAREFAVEDMEGTTWYVGTYWPESEPERP